MKKVFLSECRQGDVLARSIVALSGVVLAGEGTALTCRLIHRFGESGIESIWISGSDRMDRKDFDERKTRIEKRFCAAGSHSFLLGIKKILLDSLKKQAGIIDAVD